MAGSSGEKKPEYFVHQAGQVLLKRWVVTSYLGRGTFSTVLKCRERDTGREVAVKVSRKEPKYHDAGMRELQTLIFLKKKDPADMYHCIRARKWFEIGGHVFAVYDLLGPSLLDLLRVAPFTDLQIRHAAKQLIQCTAFLHSIGLAHTDIKPENVLSVPETLNASGNHCGQERFDVKLVDFGSALFESELQPKVMTTKTYRAPEVFARARLTSKLDMWSLGCMLYEMRTRRVLLRHGTDSAFEALVLMSYVTGCAIPAAFEEAVLGGCLELGLFRRWAQASVRNETTIRHHLYRRLLRRCAFDEEKAGKAGAGGAEGEEEEEEEEEAAAAAHRDGAAPGDGGGLAGARGCARDTRHVPHVTKEELAQWRGAAGQRGRRLPLLSWGLLNECYRVLGGVAAKRLEGAPPLGADDDDGADSPPAPRAKTGRKRQRRRGADGAGPSARRRKPRGGEAASTPAAASLNPSQGSDSCGSVAVTAAGDVNVGGGAGANGQANGDGTHSPTHGIASVSPGAPSGVGGSGGGSGAGDGGPAGGGGEAEAAPSFTDERGVERPVLAPLPGFEYVPGEDPATEIRGEWTEADVQRLQRWRREWQRRRRSVYSCDPWSMLLNGACDPALQYKLMARTAAAMGYRSKTAGMEWMCTPPTVANMPGEPELVDLLKRMLAMDPRRRISAEDALDHPYLRLP